MVDIVVVGGGHAGCEAALAAARLGHEVALVTLELEAVGRMSCNPALGGLGKGHLVREVDALGGAMGLLGDATGIQFRRLNLRKGAAVRGTRVQSDRRRYAAAMQSVLRAERRLTLLEGEVAALRLAPGERVEGVELADGRAVGCRAAVLTTGTFLGGRLHVGLSSRPGGREGEPAACRLADWLRAQGLRLGRLKTGTPCRLDGRSLELDRLEVQQGDDPPPRLSCWSAWPGGRPPLAQRPCHITYTNPRTHELIRRGLDRSPLYRGQIVGVGPRYCPSIEDKVVRFPDRHRHQIFLEPEGVDSDEVYPNGISTSLPADLQQELVRSITGLERASLLRPGYAVEYDFLDPQQATHALAVRGLDGLFVAGQLCGTSGYEEAAAQGLLAGINAARAASGREPLIVRREQAYLGVMVDDLVLRGTGEPYRMFTSRAEHRLLLREDNADTRLTPLGRELGLIDDERWARFARREERRARLRSHLAQARVPAPAPARLDELLAAAGSAPSRPGAALLELLRRPEVSLGLLERAGLVPEALAAETLVAEQAEIALKYEGYIARQEREAARLARLEHLALPPDLDLERIPGLRREVLERLTRLQPQTLGQAARIAGVTPAAIALLEIHLRARRRIAAREPLT